MKNNKSKKLFNFILLFVFTILVLFFSLKDNFFQIINEIINLNKIWILVGFLLTASYWFFESIVLQKIVQHFKPDYSLKKAFILQMEINFFNAITPFSSGGQPYQIYRLKKEKLKLADATNVAIMNFIVFQISLVLISIIAIICNRAFDIFTKDSVLANLVLIGFIVNFFHLLVFVLTFFKRINKFIVKVTIKLLTMMKIIKNKEKITKKFNKYLNELHEGSADLFKDKKELMFLILISSISFICLFLAPLSILYASGDYTSFNGLTCIVSSTYVMMLGSIIPIPGGTGGVEYGFVKFFGEFVNGNILNAMMLMWRLITYYFAMITGAIVFNLRGKKEKI